MAIAHLMLDQQNYVLGPGRRGGVPRLPRPAAAQARASPTAAACATRSTAPGCGRPTALFAEGSRQLSRERADDDQPGRHPRSERLRRGPRARGRRPASPERRRRSEPAWAARSSSASSATRRRARRPSRAGSSACSARTTSPTSASTTTTATTAASGPSRNITPLHPDCNYMDIMAPGPRAHAQRRADPEAGLPAPGRHLRPARARRPGAVLGRRGPARLLHARSCATLRRARSTSAPPEELRRSWKVQRDCSRRGYTTDQVLAELDRREPDSEAFIRPQRRYADIVVSFLPGARRPGPGAPRRRARRCATA